MVVEPTSLILNLVASHYKYYQILFRISNVNHLELPVALIMYTILDKIIHHSIDLIKISDEYKFLSDM